MDNLNKRNKLTEVTCNELVKLFTSISGIFINFYNNKFNFLKHNSLISIEPLPLIELIINLKHEFDDKIEQYEKGAYFIPFIFKCF